MDRYLNETVSAFVAGCAERTPTPGGGSGAALVGAVGAALGEMAGRFSQSERATELVAGLQGLLLNVRINARSLPDQDSTETDRISREAARLRVETLEAVNAMLLGTA